MNQIYDYIHELRNRQMALRARIEDSLAAGEIKFQYGEDHYQEEARCMGLRMIRDGLEKEGEQVILDFTKEHYPDQIDNERVWIGKMMRYLNAITDTLLDNIRAEGYIALQSNVELPNENAIFHPIRHLNIEHLPSLAMNGHSLVDLSQPETVKHLEGWLYYQSDKN
ncbi:hypothetical protein KO02_10800 [Sphingobacterium sp. ML3W]|uniref:hypothetical protein n=1 Tax=Sphingobacterium sp. ML3W TaxID=1538644 RepID=UPI0004F70410|nr:hypothetical protein [Sphingobacterium sp. ML3W]AIM37124.1 hypothetical protein KO02_10800 [Sphingobacterium sp. ML3W]